jgi:hypothetical protein
LAQTNFGVNQFWCEAIRCKSIWANQFGCKAIWVRSNLGAKQFGCKAIWVKAIWAQSNLGASVILGALQGLGRKSAVVQL